MNSNPATQPRACRGPCLRPSVIAVVRKLQVDAVVVLSDEGDDLLQAVAVFAAYADDVSVDRGLHRLLGVLDGLDDLARLLDADALLQLHLLAHSGAGRGLDLAVLEVLQR